MYFIKPFNILIFFLLDLKLNKYVMHTVESLKFVGPMLVDCGFFVNLLWCKFMDVSSHSNPTVRTAMGILVLI